MRKQFYISNGWSIYHIIVTITQEGGGHAFDLEVYAQNESGARNKIYKEVLGVSDGEKEGDTFEYKGITFTDPCHISFKKGPLNKLRSPLDASSTSDENYYPGGEEYDIN